MVHSAMRELCLPGLEDLLLLPAVVEANESKSDHLDSRFGLSDHFLPRSSIDLGIPRDDTGTGTSDLPVTL